MIQNFDFPIEKLFAPVRYLNLDQRGLNALRRIGIQKVVQIILAGKYDILQKRNFGPSTVDRILFAAAEYLGISQEVLESDEIWQIALLASKGPSSPLSESVTADETNQFSVTKDLRVALNSLWIDERGWSVIELRAFRLLSLREIGDELGGVSKERVRQILDRGYEKIQHRLSLLLGFCDYLDERAKHIRDEITTEELALPALIDKFERELSGSNFVTTR